MTAKTDLIQPTGPPRVRCLLALLVLATAVVSLGLSGAKPQSRPDEAPIEQSLVVDPNTVPPHVLSALPRLGPTRSQRIVEARRQGPFRSLADLCDRVKGIGPVTGRALRPFLRFPPAPPQIASNPNIPKSTNGDSSTLTSHQKTHP